MNTKKGQETQKCFVVLAQTPINYSSPCYKCNKQINLSIERTHQGTLTNQKHVISSLNQNHHQLQLVLSNAHPAMYEELIKICSSLYLIVNVYLSLTRKTLGKDNKLAFTSLREEIQTQSPIWQGIQIRSKQNQNFKKILISYQK